MEQEGTSIDEILERNIDFKELDRASFREISEGVGKRYSLFLNNSNGCLKEEERMLLIDITVNSVLNKIEDIENNDVSEYIELFGKKETAKNINKLFERLDNPVYFIWDPKKGYIFGNTEKRKRKDGRDFILFKESMYSDSFYNIQAVNIYDIIHIVEDNVKREIETMADYLFLNIENKVINLVNKKKKKKENGNIELARKILREQYNITSRKDLIDSPQLLEDLFDLLFNHEYGHYFSQLYITSNFSPKKIAQNRDQIHILSELIADNANFKDKYPSSLYAYLDSLMEKSPLEAKRLLGLKTVQEIYKEYNTNNLFDTQFSNLIKVYETNSRDKLNKVTNINLNKAEYLINSIKLKK